MSQQINLYEERLRPRNERLTGRSLGIAVGVVLVAVVAATVVEGYRADRAAARLAALQSERTALQERLVALTKATTEERIPAALQSEIDANKTAVASRGEVLDALASGFTTDNSGFSEVMAGFARQTTGDVWLTGFSIGGGGQAIEIRGRLLDSTRLPAYVQRLSAEPAFQGRRFATLTMHRIDPDEVKVEPAGVLTKDSTPQAQRPQRYIDFVLRSENAATPDATSGGKK